MAIIWYPMFTWASCMCTCLDWREVCATLLGVVLEERDIFGQRLHLTWLIEHFPSLSLDANVESVRYYVRAFILQLIRGFLFADKSNNRVHLMFLPLLEDFGVIGNYSWGSVCLAWIKRCVEQPILMHMMYQVLSFCYNYRYGRDFPL